MALQIRHLRQSIVSLQSRRYGSSGTARDLWVVGGSLRTTMRVQQVGQPNIFWRESVFSESRRYSHKGKRRSINLAAVDVSSPTAGSWSAANSCIGDSTLPASTVVPARRSKPVATDQAEV